MTAEFDALSARLDQVLAHFADLRDADRAEIEQLREQLRERFDGQQLSVREALVASEKHKDERFAAIWTEFHEHIVAVREENRLAFDASEKALDKAHIAMERRLDGMNEFRDQLRDQAATFMRRDESIQRHDAAGERIDALERRLSERIEAWKTDSNKAHDVLDDKIAAMGSRLDKRDGERAGSMSNTRNIYAFIAAAGVVITIVVTLVVLIANGKLGG